MASIVHPIALMCHSHGHLVLQLKNICAAAITSVIALTWLRTLQLRMHANAPQHVLHEICMCQTNQRLSGVMDRLSKMRAILCVLHIDKKKV